MPFFFFVMSILPNLSSDSSVLVVFSVTTSLALYSVGVVSGHGNLKQVQVAAQHNLLICRDGGFSTSVIFAASYTNKLFFC